MPRSAPSSPWSPTGPRWSASAASRPASSPPGSGTSSGPRVLPDTAGGRAAAVGLVILLCVGITAASLDRLPLWTTLLGTGAFAGAYEFTFAAAPPELVSTSLSTATTLLLNVGVGFLAAALVAPGAATGLRNRPAHRDTTSADASDDDTQARLDDFMMEKNQ